MDYVPLSAEPVVLLAGESVVDYYTVVIIII